MQDQEAYYQLASCDGNELLAEISNQFPPHGAALDGVAQRRLAALGFEPPSEEWPSWNIRFEADSADVVRRVAASMAYALLECLQGDGSELFEGLLLEYVESHPDTARDPEWGRRCCTGRRSVACGRCEQPSSVAVQWRRRDVRI